jgi:hypothetical protein
MCTHVSLYFSCYKYDGTNNPHHRPSYRRTGKYHFRHLYYLIISLTQECLLLCQLTCNDVKWVPCHHCMGRPQVADGGDGLQIWTVAASTSNKQSRTANWGWSSSLGFGRGARNTRTVKPRIYYDTLKRDSDQDGFFGTN